MAKNIRGRGMRARPKGTGRKLSSGKPPKSAMPTHDLEEETETTSEPLVDQGEWGGIGHNSRKATKEVETLPVERVAETATLQQRLLGPDENQVREFVEMELKPDLLRLAGASNEALYAALDRAYDIGLVVKRRPKLTPDRRPRLTPSSRRFRAAMRGAMA